MHTLKTEIISFPFLRSFGILFFVFNYYDYLLRTKPKLVNSRMINSNPLSVIIIISNMELDFVRNIHFPIVLTLFIDFKCQTDVWHLMILYFAQKLIIIHIYYSTMKLYFQCAIQLKFWQRKNCKWKFGNNF